MFLTGSTGAVDILSNSLTTVAGDMTSAASAAIPAALGVAAIGVVVTVGWKLFKRFTK